MLFVATFGVANAQKATFNEKSDFYVGYQFIRQNADSNQRDFRFNRDTDSHGVNGSYTYYFGNKSAGLTTEVGVNFAKNDTVLATYMSGVTLKRRSGEIQPFVKAVIGAGTQKARDEFTRGFNRTNTGLAFAVGGGVDVKLSEKVSLRAIQADYLQTRVFNSTQNNLRLGVGLVF